MGSRKAWGCGCLGCGGLWVVLSTLAMLAFQSLGATDPPGHGSWAIVAFLPAMLPVVIGFVLLMAEYQATAPERRQQSIDRVATALAEQDGMTAEEIARELDLSHSFTREAVAELIADGRLTGYIEAGTGRIHAMDPMQVSPEQCPACGEALLGEGARVTCPECGSRVLRPDGSEEGN